jgi:hypothetical protein
MHIFAKTDTVMEMLMQRLNMPIPPFRLLRRIIVGRREQAGQVYTKAVDAYDPTLEVGIICAVDWNRQGVPQSAFKDPMANVCKGSHQHKAGSNLVMAPKVHFIGHYREPPLQLQVDLSEATAVDTLLSFDPYAGEWAVLAQNDVADGKFEAP